MSGLHALLVHQTFISPEEAGGTRHYELGRRWVQEGNRFTIVASDRSYLTAAYMGQEGKLISEEDLDGIRLLRVYAYSALHKSFLTRAISFLSFSFTSFFPGIFAKDVDIVMGTTPPMFQAPTAWLLAAMRRRPFLLEVRDLWPEFAIDIGVLKDPLLIWMARRMENFLYARATHILVNSPAYRDYLIEKKGVKSEKITLIPNGVDVTMFDPEATGDEVRRQYGLEDKFVVTYAGAIGMANDLDSVVRAAALLAHDPRIHFLIVGDGKERERVAAQARELGCANVTFTGGQPKTRMKDFLAASDAGVAILKNIPMFTTTYPNKVFDYMAAGRPIVLAIDGVIRKVVEDGHGGLFVPPGDPEALAKAVTRLAADPARARQMGANGRDFVARNFNREHQAVQFVELLERIARR